MASSPPIDATLNIVAECAAGVWTLYAVPAVGNRQMLGAGTAGSGISFPVKLLERLTSGVL